MKLVYCIASVYNPGGMERVLLNKLRWWLRRGDCELLVVTTDQQGRPPFYEFPPEVRMVDLGINYTEDLGRGALAHTLAYLRKRRLHRKALTELLMREKADFVISLFPSESSFIPRIKDGSRKILELHFNKQFRLQYNRKGLMGLADRIRMRMDERLVRRFDRLLDAWALIPEELRKTWRLDIFGQGEWEQLLKDRILQLGIADSARINAPTSHIFEEYAASDFLVMTSHYEGFPMVMIEAMACGVPAVSFDFLCGPRDIIAPGLNGIIVSEGDIPALAAEMQRLMEDPARLENMSAQARKISEAYSEDAVMGRWNLYFTDMLRK